MTKGKQWDNKTYYYAAKTYFSGDNPYKNEALSRAAGENIVFPFVYPPPTLFFFKPFLLFNYVSSIVVVHVFQHANYGGSNHQYTGQQAMWDNNYADEGMNDKVSSVRIKYWVR